MFQKYINLKFLNNLNYCDLLQKFNYKTYYIIPKLNKLTLKIYLKGSLNTIFLNLYLKNFLLLYFFCFNLISSSLKFKKIRRRKLKSYSVKLWLSYSFTKKKILSSIFNFFFLFKKFLRPFYFSNKLQTHSFFSGRLKTLTSKIITFIPGLMLLDHKEQRFFPYFKKSKIFLVLNITNFISLNFYNYFILEVKQNTKYFLKNFLMLWCLL